MLGRAWHRRLFSQFVCMLIVPAFHDLPCERPAGYRAPGARISESRAHVGPTDQTTSSPVSDNRDAVPSD